MSRYRRTLIASATAYAGASYYCLQNPDLLHMKNSKTKELMAQKRVLFSHRGGAIENPENTM